MSKKDKKEEGLVSEPAVVSEVKLEVKEVKTAVAPAPKEEAKEEVPAGLVFLEEDKPRLKFVFEWINHLSRGSRNVDFRRSAKDAIAGLSKYL